MKRLRRMTIAIALVLMAASISVTVVVIYHVREDETSVVLASTRRVNGDVVILSFAPVFSNIEDTRQVVETAEQVERARIFTIYPVRIESAVARAPGLLKLAPLDQSLAQQLRISDHAVAVNPGQLPALVFGESLASRLRLRVGDFFAVHVTGDGQIAKDASVRCRVGWIVDWGLAYHNDQLIFGDLLNASEFGLSPIGIEVITKSPDARGSVARDLQERLGSLFKVLSVEDLLAARTNPLPMSSH